MELNIQQQRKIYVFDTNIITAALRSRLGASFLILQSIRHDLITGCISPALFFEYADVLQRGTQLANFWIDPHEVDIILDVLAQKLIPVNIFYTWRPQLKDPNDEMVLDCAINGKAQAIVTFNQKDFLPAADYFQIQLLQPNQLVKSLNLKQKLEDLTS